MKTHLLAVALTLDVIAAAPGASAADPSDTQRGAYPISWRPCPDRPEVQCGTQRVPVDWSRPRGEKVTLAIARRPATDPAHRVGALFVNPGGPGGGGVQIAVNADLIFSPESVSRFDVVGVDPRGIAGSTPVSCRIPPPQPGYTLFQFPCGQAWGHDAEHLGYMAATWTSRHATRQVVVIVNSGAFDHDAPVSAAMRDVLVTAYCDR